jgi:hypothetical protein
MLLLTSETLPQQNSDVDMLTLSCNKDNLQNNNVNNTNERKKQQWSIQVIISGRVLLKYTETIANFACIFYIL